MPLPDWEKVLVVDFGFLGDTVHSVPALRALAGAGAKVDVMTTPVGAELLSMVPEINRVWVTPLHKPSPPWWQGLAQLFEIRSEKYDVALTFSGADRNLFSAAFSGARERIATLRRRRWWFGFLPLTQSIPAPPANRPLFRQRLEVLKVLGLSGSSPGWALKVPSAADEKTPSCPAPTVYLSVSAFGTPQKEWPLENWAAAVRKAWEQRPEINFLVGFAPNKREFERARQLLQMIPDSPRFRILDSAPTLVELAAILQKTTCFAGLDSGVLHLAMALGRPTVSTFRDYAGMAEWVPEGEAHRVLSRFCSCHQDQIDRCGFRAECLAAVSAREVADAILALLSIRG